MNKQQTGQNRLSYAVIAFGLLFVVFVMVIASVTVSEPDPQARLIAQEKWSKNDLFMNTLKRYNDIYHRLKQRHDKEALAVAYLTRITEDLFLFPSKTGAVNVILPATNSSTSYILKEINIGPDNGLYTALHHMLNRYKGGFRPAPFYLVHTDQLMLYIMTGQEVIHLLNEDDIFKGR